VYLTLACYATALLAQFSPSMCAVATWRAAMWHVNYGLDDDLVLFVLLLIHEFCPGGQRLTCEPTLPTNQMRPWD